MVQPLSKLASKKTLRVAGLMSGTSADGVDVAIIDAGPSGLKLLAFQTVPYQPAVRREIFRLFEPQTSTVDRICQMNFVLGGVFADALVKVARAARIKLGSIDLVGSHGQTIYHIGGGRLGGGERLGQICQLGKIRSTLQIGEPSLIAQRTGITTVADFRPRDIAAGGQGAPLVPYADFAMFAHRRLSRAVQNIGGIANVTFLPAGGGLDDVAAFDTGPGNMIMDRLAWRCSSGRLTCDVDGKMATCGKVHAGLLAELMRHPYLRRRPPKTAGREQFGAELADVFYRKAKSRRIEAYDIIATAAAFTAASIAEAYRRFLPHVDQVILCGGGARNPTLVKMLRDELGRVDVVIMDDLGINADAKEAISFALLAAATIRGQANNVPSATGALKAVVLGKIIPGEP